MELIRDQILAGAFKPGQRLGEVELSQTLGVSRSPIREAIRQLAAEGLLNVEPQKGASVPNPDPEQLKELFVVREALEVMAVRLVVESCADSQLEELRRLHDQMKAVMAEEETPRYPSKEDFHHKIWELSGNRKLLESLERINAQIRLARTMSGWKPQRAVKAHEEHAQIVECIENRDADKAAELMQLHLRNAMENSVEMMLEWQATGVIE